MITSKEWAQRVIFHLEELVTHILEMESCLFGMTPKDVRYLAFQLAEKNGIRYRFNKDKQLAGKKWYYAFMKRHP